jgi:TRAP-type C4-dicarboxylate transport system permease small subunit
MPVPQAGPTTGPVQQRAAKGSATRAVAHARVVLTALSVALLASYFVLVLLQVFFRYVINESLFWAEELVRGLMVWGVMVSSALVTAGRGHIRVEVLELMLAPLGRRIVVGIANVLCIAFSLILLWAAIELMDRSWFQKSPLLEVPKYTVYMAIAIGAALEALMVIFTWNDAPAAEHPADPSL